MRDYKIWFVLASGSKTTVSLPDMTPEMLAEAIVNAEALGHTVTHVKQHQNRRYLGRLNKELRALGSLSFF